NLRNNRLTDEGVAALAHSQHLANLTCLDLSTAILVSRYGAIGVRRIAESQHLRNLETLRLQVSGGTAESVADPLLEPGRLPKLRDLVLNVAPVRHSELVDRFRARGVELTTFYAGD